MAKRGPKPKGKVKIEWSAHFAYAIGLIATDGNLSPDGRHVSLTSKDLEQIQNFHKSLDIDVTIGRKSRGGELEKKYYVSQFSDIPFYTFLVSIGIGPAKSKTIARVDIPDEYFFDFLRGVLDGDGYMHSYFDPRWRSSFLWYLGFCSASPLFLEWIQNKLFQFLTVKGHITRAKGSSCLQLKYAKTEAEIIVAKLYEDCDTMALSRKKLKLFHILSIVSLLEEKSHNS